MTLREQLGKWYDVNLVRYEFTKEYMKKLSAILRVERMNHTIRPTKENTFRAFRLTPPDEVKVVILGQDPYPHESANGLAFSSNETLGDIPPSLKNIFKEVEDDIGFQPYHNPDLARWAKQGVFLLNTCLTVRDKHPGSHSDIGWQRFTKTALQHLYRQERPIVFLLWGRQAHYYGTDIPEPHKVFYSGHPSPYTAVRGFFGTKPFSRANEVLEEHYNTKIDWLKNEER